MYNDLSIIILISAGKATDCKTMSIQYNGWEQLIATKPTSNIPLMAGAFVKDDGCHSLQDMFAEISVYLVSLWVSATYLLPVAKKSKIVIVQSIHKTFATFPSLLLHEPLLPIAEVNYQRQHWSKYVLINIWHPYHTMGDSRKYQYPITEGIFI